MNRRLFVQSLGAAATVLPLANVVQAATVAKRPNILFIMTDQQRGDWMGCMGDLLAHTPNMDALAKDGMLFRQAYSSMPTCTPARAVLLTGQDAWHCGMLGYGNVPRTLPNDFPVLLQKAGYNTAAFGKQHFNNHRHGYQYECLYEGLSEASDTYKAWIKRHYPHMDPYADGLGWNVWKAETWVGPEEAHPTKWLTDRTIEWLEAYDDTKKPFMVKVSYHRPHSPYDPPQRWQNFYANKEIALPQVGEWTKALSLQTHNGGANATSGKMPDADVKFTIRAYRALISHLDEEIGNLIAYLKTAGRYDNTLILLTADHGDMRGDNNLWRKGYAYEGSVRVPMIVKAPTSYAIKGKGLETTKPVELRDVAPTFLDVAGVTSTPEPMQGESLLKLMVNPDALWREWIDLEHSTCYFSWNQWTALTDGKKKFIHLAGNDTEQFFDLTTDPRELVNLINDAGYQEEIAIWRQRLVDYLTPRGTIYVKDGVLQKRVRNTVYRSSIDPTFRKKVKFTFS